MGKEREIELPLNTCRGSSRDGPPSRNYFETVIPQTEPLMWPYEAVRATTQVDEPSPGRVMMRLPLTLVVNEMPVPVVFPVTVPSMITPAPVVQSSAASDSEPVLVHDRYPEGQFTLTEALTVIVPPPTHLAVALLLPPNVNSFEPDADSAWVCIAAEISDATDCASSCDRLADVPPQEMAASAAATTMKFRM